ncbi:Radial spoke head 1 [Cichlidogyrus casuarinus]|uniref:Radial spoke head 1 n=1 Tax=Cichlidogyrus casuarinus TaxID=1844966 RepID=A0ABD2PQ41_9PLAT
MSDDEDVGEEDGGLYLGEYEGGRNEQDERHGYGKAILPNGDTYEGYYVDGKRHGQGVYRFKSGARYFGDYKENKKHGKGVFYYPDGSHYDGEWIEDQRAGLGIYTYINGDTYQGDWRDNTRSGRGTYTFSQTGLKYAGLWKNGKMNGNGELVTDHHKYVGTWKNGLVQGKGKYVFPRAGCIQTGEYITVKKDPSEVEEDEDQEPVPRWKASKIERFIDINCEPPTESELHDIPEQNPELTRITEKQETEGAEFEQQEQQNPEIQLSEQNPELTRVTELTELQQQETELPLESEKQETEVVETPAVDAADAEPSPPEVAPDKDD